MTGLLITGLVALTFTGLGLGLALLVRQRSQTEVPASRHNVNRELAKSQIYRLSDETTAENQLEIVEETKLAFLDSTADNEDAPVKNPSVGKWPILGIATVIPFLTGMLYWTSWGDPAAVELQHVEWYKVIHPESDISYPADDLLSIEGLIQRRIKSNPDEPSNWLYLTSIQQKRGDFAAVGNSHRRANELGHVLPYLDTTYLDMLARYGSFPLADYDKRVIVRTIERNAPLPFMVSLLAYRYKLDENDPVGAYKYVEQLQGQAMPEATRDILEVAVANLQQVLTEANIPLVIVQVDIDIDDDVSSYWVTVLARSEFGGPPLAVVRRPIQSHRSYEFLLTDGQAMQPGLDISSVDEVSVVAQISETSAVASEAPLYRVSRDGVRPNEQPTVQLVIRPSEAN